MTTIHITQRIDSETLHLPQLRPWLGKHVEIIIRESPTTVSPPDRTEPWVSPLAGSILRDDDPFGPAVPPDEWEANR